MSVPPIQMAAVEWAGAAAGTMASPWHAGAVVFGRVLEQVFGTRLILQIGGLTVEVDPPVPQPLPVRFQARVITAGAKPLLEVLSAAPHDQAPVAAVRARLPKQGGWQPVLSDLQALSRAADSRSLPEPVRIALARLEASIVDRADLLDPGVLRDALKRGGQQLEHALLQYARAGVPQSGAALGYDLKAALQRLAAALQKLPGAPSAGTSSLGAPSDPPPPLLELPLAPQPRLPPPAAPSAFDLAGAMLQHAEAALARIEIMQLEAHPEVSPQAWMVEIPVRDDGGFDVLQLRFEQEGGSADVDQVPRWTLGFILEPPRLGVVQGLIHLRGKRVNVDLWAVRGDAVSALEAQAVVLPQLLSGSGLELGQLRIRQGLPTRYTGLGHKLLETSA